MLILSRKAKQAVIIGDNIVVRVAEILGDSVKLAIDAPREISIVREEVFKSVKSSNTQAAHKTGQANISPKTLEAARKLISK